MFPFLSLCELGTVQAEPPAIPELWVPENVPNDEPPPVEFIAPRLPQMRMREGQIGIAARGIGSWILNATPVAEYGVGAALLFRMSARVTVELDAQYHATAPIGDGYAQSDIPIYAGLRLQLGAANWRLSPYLTASVGADYSRISDVAGDMTAWYFDSTYGAGGELRIGVHAALTFDVRGNTRVRLDHAATPSTGDLQGLQVCTGTEFYF